MKYPQLLLLSLFLCGATSFAGEESADGVYLALWAGAGVTFASESIELKKGRFTIRRFNDVEGAAKPESGTYRRYGVRLVFLGDAADFIEAWISFTYDGVPLLMDPNNYRGFLRSQKLNGLIFVPIPAKDANPQGWKRFFDKHPKFWEAVQPPEAAKVPQLP